MFLKIFEENPNEKKINILADILKKGGVVIYPTDTVYAVGCDVHNINAIRKLAALKNKKVEKTHFSIICQNISQITDYANIDNGIFRLLKHNTPGPFTFILPASNSLKKVFVNKRKHIGVRIPKNNTILKLVEKLGNPILTSSIKNEDEIIEYITNPERIFEKYKKRVDAVIDGGIGRNVASTIIDCTGNEFNIIRQGIGNL